MKQCKKYMTVKPLDEFYRAAGMRDGYRNDCKSCNAAASRVRYPANPRAEIARVKRWQQANADRVNAYHRARRSDPAVKRAERSGYLKRKYGLTIEQYEAMLTEQGGGCGICGRAPSDSFSLHIDHDHRTGRVRGLLCFVCNSSLGELDDPDLLRAALRYVEPPVARDLLVEARLAELKARRLARAG
jgi:hypothetical protein